jgi:ferrous-iron efflux pump FieF
MSEADTYGPTLRKLAANISLASALVLVAVKLLGWLATGSVALLTSAIDALVDAGTSLVTNVGVRYSARPPDDDHRFGHGKGEAVAGFTQAAVLAGAAVTLAVQSVERLLSPEPIRALNLGIWIIVGSLVVAAALVATQTYVVRRTGSTAIAADRAHYITDVAVNVAVLLALGVTKLTGWERADPAFALAISAYMVWSAGSIAKTALAQLLDQELPAEERQRITDTILLCKGARNVHDLRTRFSGDRTFVEYHLEVDGKLTVAQGHDIGSVTELAVKNLLPGTVDVTAHLEPLGIVDQRLDEQIKAHSQSA